MGMALNEYTDEELAEEVNRRKAIQRERDMASRKPALVENPDFTELIFECDLALENVIQNGGSVHERQRYVYVDAMQALYGENVFEWMRSKAT